MKPEAHGRYKTKGEISSLLPDFIAPSILEVDFVKLKRLGVKYILIDLDQTLRRIGSWHIDDTVLVALRNLKQGGSFKSISLVTNNYWPKRFASALGITAYTPFWEGLRPIRKPNRKFFKRVLAALGAQPSEAVMIGDKLRADVIGANNAGMLTVLVSPRGRDYFFDRLLLSRYREKRSLKKARATLAARLKNKIRQQRRRRTK